MIDHWHPVLDSRKLKRRRVAQVRLCGRDIALFRTDNRTIGALDDFCPHRRMKLSAGSVVGDRLQCRYHGWTFTCDGTGESPGTPKLTACAGNYETREEYGYIWLKPRGVEAVFPQFETAGMLHMANLDHFAPAPLEVAVDNFCEIEHTATIHDVFGYKLDRMKDVHVRFEPTDTTVRVINVGVPKNLGWFTSRLAGIRRNYVFTDDWTTHFSPVYSVYDHFWSDPETGREARVRYRLYMFFTPVDDKATRVTTFAFARSTWPIGPGGGLRPFRPLMRRMLDKEIALDCEVLANLANYDTALEGMKLSRFDKALGLNRERIERIYKGNAAV